MAQDTESQFGTGEQADMGAAHHDSMPKAQVDLHNFAQLMQLAIPHATVRQTVKALEGKASRAAIGHYRTGRKKPPQWVLDRLYALTIERAQRLTSSIEPSVCRAILGTRNLKAFMARRARERDAQKKKPD